MGLYTSSYALETWRAENRFGGIALFVLAGVSAVLIAWILGWRS